MHLLVRAMLRASGASFQVAFADFLVRVPHSGNFVRVSSLALVAIAVYGFLDSFSVAVSAFFWEYISLATPSQLSRRSKPSRRAGFWRSRVLAKRQLNQKD